jgi:hypothetical protein
LIRVKTIRNDGRIENISTVFNTENFAVSGIKINGKTQFKIASMYAVNE